tara:strand:+ start:128 stop:472 length:345 start_codon:yes stop_codon:yes gene_type:complete
MTMAVTLSSVVVAAVEALRQQVMPVEVPSSAQAAAVVAVTTTRVQQAMAGLGVHTRLRGAVLAEVVQTPEMMEPLVVMDVVMGAEAVLAMLRVGTMEGMEGLPVEEAVPEATLA